MTSKRKSIGKTNRFNIFKRDNFTCQYCGNTPPAVILEIDHIHPVSKGGDEKQDNLITACMGCNRGKSANLLTQIPISFADKAAEIAEREAQIKAYRKIIDKAEKRIMQDAWSIAVILKPECNEDGFPKTCLSTLKMFLKRLPIHEVAEAAEIAYEKKNRSDIWPYFCGICWNKIKRPRNG